MFDKRLMEVCPESKKYIAGNIILQWMELFLNTIMILIVANAIQKIYEGSWKLDNLVIPVLIILFTIECRFFTTMQRK